MVNPLKKGKTGEDEACRWLSKYLYSNKINLQRNKNQSFIGCDIFSFPFIFEVKRRETLALNSWWRQIDSVNKKLFEFKSSYIPVVMFRQNRGEWEFLISAETIGCNHGYIRLTEATFAKWAQRYVS